MTESPVLLARYGSRIRTLWHPFTRGYGVSLKMGLLATRFENILFIDTDGPHDPADISAVVEAFRKKECVFTVRPRLSLEPRAYRPCA